jgi:DinB superfamily
MRKNSFYLLVLALATTVVLSPATGLAQASPAQAAPKAAKSPSTEVLEAWNEIGRKLVDMAEDFPEDKYDFKATPAQRTFADNLLHVASDYCREISAIKGSQVGPAITPDKDFTRKDFPTKADVVKLLKQTVADGAAVIKEQGEAGLTRESKSPYEDSLQHVWYTWMGSIEHAGEHYGQLVVYYRVAGLVPPESRPKK